MSAVAPSSAINFARGAALIVLAMALFDVMGAVIKHLGVAYPAMQLAFLRNIFGLIPAIAILAMTRAWHDGGRPVLVRQWRLGLARGVLVVGAQACFYTSLIHLEFATATTLAFCGPLFITALSMPVLGERVGVWRWLAVCVGFAGIVLVMRPGTDVFSVYALLPVGAALGYASSSILIRRVDADVPTALFNVYAAVGALVTSAGVVGAAGAWQPVASVHDWLWIGAMGMAGGIAVLVLITAYRSAEPASLAPFEYFGIPFSYALGWFVFAEAPFERLFPGALLIVAGGLLIVWRERVNARQASADKTA